MTPIEALSAEDKQLISDYIKDNVNRDYRTEQADVDYVLRFWNDAKSKHLWKLFGEKLIISIPIEYNIGVHEISTKFDNMRLFSLPFWSQITHLNWGKDNDNARYEVQRDFNHVFSWQNLAKNSCDTYYDWTDTDNSWPDNKEYVIFPLGNGKNYKVCKGTKPMKALRKIAESYGIDMELFQDFCNKHSECLNQKKLKGNLCLSIHPLDYMTMSDNACGWHSCMSWQNDGEYKQGTVEMMNSASVVVAYLEADEKFKCLSWCPREWNNKKWRSLFIVDPEFIVNVKGYPYHNEYLVKEIIQLFADRAGWGEVETAHYDDWEGATMHDGKRHVRVRFDTGCMYNDFGSNHFIALNPNREEDLYDDCYCYSGVSECMWCGGIDEIGEDQGADALSCDSCYHRVRCEECGEVISGEEYYYHGMTVCYDCYENLTYEEEDEEED